MAAALIALALVLSLTRTDPGPLIHAGPDKKVCEVARGRTSFTAVYTLTNSGDQPATINRLGAAHLDNVEITSLKIRGYLETNYRPFSPTYFTPENDVQILLRGRVLDAKKDAQISGIKIAYTSSLSAGPDLSSYEGRIPWTFTFARTACPS